MFFGVDDAMDAPEDEDDPLSPSQDMPQLATAHHLRLQSTSAPARFHVPGPFDEAPAAQQHLAWLPLSQPRGQADLAAPTLTFVLPRNPYRKLVCCPECERRRVTVHYGECVISLRTANLRQGVFLSIVESG